MPTESFTNTDSEQTWTVPDSTQAVKVRTWGAEGGDGDNGGGEGGYAEGTLSVTPGETLYIYVGGEGEGSEENNNNGGWNGGGRGGVAFNDDTYSGGGGGATDVRQSGSTLSDRVIVAGGGGGGGDGGGSSWVTPGGDGGADTGEDANDTSAVDGGHGGTQTAGGAGMWGGDDGSLLDGGDCGNATDSNGGGGGGGYYGGGGGGATSDGGDYGAGGGGGSNYVGGVTSTTSQRGGRTGNGLVEIEYSPPPGPPESVNSTVNANDDVGLSIDKGTSGGPVDGYEVQIDRDGNGWADPAGGPSTVNDDGSASYTVTYGPNSDNPYYRQVGIDSAFQFRVRQYNTAEDGTQQYSDWVTSSTVYTDPIPPHNPSVSRPDANTVDIEFEVKSDVVSGSYLRVQLREDTGTGYGSWSTIQNIGGTNYFAVDETTVQGSTRVKGDTVIARFNVGQTYQSDGLQEDTRYQFRLRHDGVGSDSRSSEWVYADYGNQGNVWFEDGFESGDFSSWDNVEQDAIAGTPNAPDSGFTSSDADEGSNFCRLDASGRIEKNLGDLSGETDVIVKCAMAAGSMDTSAEYADLEWYDGSGWNNLRQLGHEYNRQGWVEVTALVPDSWLSTDNRVAFDQEGGGGDYTYVDRVIVSDILHEYTEPAQVSNIQLDTSVDREITATWTVNASFPYNGNRADVYVHDGSGSDVISDWRNSGFTLTGLLDGERYEFYVRQITKQDRHGESGTNYWRPSSYDTETTLMNLPAPQDASVSNVAATTADYSWNPQHNNGDTLVQYKPSDASSWQTYSSVGNSVTDETVDGLRNGEEYDWRVVAQTEYTETVDQ